MPRRKRHTDYSSDASAPGDAGPRVFDGIICFGGEDWWYHNRGHFDMQMMRQMSNRLPVLYVNSIGMRTPMPREGRMFFTRIGRKLRSIRRGFVRLDDRFSVLSPPVLPSRAGMALTRRLMIRRINAAAHRQGIRRPLVWIACPTAAEALAGLDPAAVVYQRTDRYECYGGIDAERISAYDRRLRSRADLTVFCSSLLVKDEAESCRSACLIDHGVDFDRFAAATESGAREPDDIAHLPRPRIGFVGGIDAHTFDPDLLLEVAALLPDAQFVLVGACSLPAGWCDRSNVTLLGQRAYEDVASYMAACDALIMPWKRGRWIEACNPVKLKEYLATGRPVISAEFPELRRYEGLVRTANSAGGFAEAIIAALREPGDEQRRRDRVRDESWPSRADVVVRKLADLGIEATTQETEHRRETVELKIAAESRPTPAVGAAGSPLDLAACILLAGGLRPSPLVNACGRSVLDLWLTADHSLLEEWYQRLAECTTDLAPLRVVHDAMLPTPWPSVRGDDRILIEQDPNVFRGPAGVLRDLCADYGPRQHVLVAEAARYASAPLGPLLLAHAATGADVTVAANEDGTPSGIYVIRCGALDLVPSVGFTDLKEQWLKLTIARGLDIRVHHLPGYGALPLRTREQFLAAARVAGGATSVDDRAGLRVICPGAFIGPRATIVDSIIMPGAVIDAEAVVARSLVCPGGSIQRGTDIADSVVTTGVCLSDVG